MSYIPDDLRETIARLPLVHEPSPNGEAIGPNLDGAALLDDVRDAITTYVIWPSHASAVAYTLWLAATHAQGAWEHATRFVVKSPIKRCGKTRAQEIGRELVHQPLSTTNISVAALVHSIDEDDPPTLILDEADSVFGGKKNRPENGEDLRGILNAGHSRRWPYIRWDPASRRRDECATFAMALIGGIGDLPDTIQDRAVVTSMRRRAPGEPVRQFRQRRALPALHRLRDELARWLSAHVHVLAKAEPSLPVEDRQADVWEPLVAVADLAGGHWPKSARNACTELCGNGVFDQETAGERLLGDLQDLWREAEKEPRWLGADVLFTGTVLERLHKIDEAPWSDWYGKPLAPRGLAKLLKPYGVASKNVRIGDEQAKGYERADLVDAWRRYVPAVPPSQSDERPRATSENERDGSRTDSDSGSVPPSDQGIQRAGDVGTDVTEAVSNAP